VVNNNIIIYIIMVGKKKKSSLVEVKVSIFTNDSFLVFVYLHFSSCI